MCRATLYLLCMRTFPYNVNLCSDAVEQRGNGAVENVEARPSFERRQNSTGVHY